jgi:hypothetical protein
MSSYGVCTKSIILYWDVHCMYYNYAMYIHWTYIVCTRHVHGSYCVHTDHFQKRICSYKLHLFQISLKAVCTEYILCSSLHSTESVPATYSKSIKAFIPIIFSLFHACQLQELPSPRPQRPERPPAGPQRPPAGPLPGQLPAGQEEKYEKLMVALFVCTRHIPLYTTIYRHMTVYVSICRDIMSRLSGFQMIPQYAKSSSIVQVIGIPDSNVARGY